MKMSIFFHKVILILVYFYNIKSYSIILVILFKKVK